MDHITREGAYHFTIRSLRALLAAAVTGGLAFGPAPSAGALGGETSTRADVAQETDAQVVRDNAKPCLNANLRPTGSNLALVDAATACLIDRIRGAAHLRPLRPSPSLQRVAAGQSAEMVLGDYFGDQNRSGQTPLQRIVATGYRRHASAISTAQNIGWATGVQATPTGIVEAWMRSPPHRQIILTREFRDLGVGAAPAAPATLAAGQPGATYTVEFGARVA